MIDNLFVFDFDDTLAETSASIGVAREYNDQNDDLFREWLVQHDLFPVNEKESNGLTYFYLSSEDFAKYQKHAAENISENIVDHFDFTATASVDISTTKENTPVINILKQAEAAPRSRVIVVTARSNSEFNSPFGKVNPTNRNDIAKFLQAAGSGIQGGQIFPVGSSDPSAKVTIVKKYIDSLGPKTVYFYDDNNLNVDAVHQLCDVYGGVPNIVTYRIVNGRPVLDSEC
tara:strand:- start:588 stop:1277 length:690 start_codon:yes stop_codon:yes gene_type:complete